MPKKTDPEVPPAPEVPAEGNEHYEVGEWRGIVQYRCKHCPYDVLDDLAAILEHVQQRHIAPAQPHVTPAGVLVADKNGNEVKPAAEVAADVYEVELKEVNDGSKNSTD